MYTYFYPPNLNEIDDITVNNYDNIQLHTISEICNLVQKWTMFWAYKIIGWGRPNSKQIGEMELSANIIS